MRTFTLNPHSATPTGNDGEIDLLRLYNSLWRGKWRILFWTVLMILVGGFYVFRMTTPLYTATATIALQNRSEQIVDLASPLTALRGDFLTINTEVAVLTSRELSSKLVDKLDLMADPNFNYTLRTSDGSSFSLGKIIGAITGLFRSSQPEEAAPPPTEEEIRRSVVDSVLGSLKVSNEYSSYVFFISATTVDPEASRKIANGIAELYIEEQIAVKYKVTEQATLWLNKRVAELKLELQAAENAVKAFAAGSDLVSAETLAALNRQLKDRRDRVQDAKDAAIALSMRVADLQAAQASQDPEKMVLATGDTVLSDMLARLDTEAARSAFDTRFRRILERVRFEARQAESKIAALEKSVAELAAQVEHQSAEQLKQEQLEREAAASRQIYEYFLGRLKEISVQQGVHRADSRILSQAMPPNGPSSPRKGMILIGSATLGIFIGIFMVLIREMRQTGTRSVRELEQATGIGVFAQLPLAPVSKRRRMLKYLQTKPSSAFAEAVRNLRTSVLLSDVDAPPQVIAITSSQPGEGKTTAALALAQSLGGLGKRVLLIEGDVRRRTFQYYFPTQRGPGLFSAVTGDQPLGEIIQYHEGLGIALLMGERGNTNAADFFSSARFAAFLDGLRDQYDVIVIDTPPVLVASDARVIGRLADTMLYAVHWDVVTLAQVQEGLRLLKSVDVKVSGLILSQVDIRKVRKYGAPGTEAYYAYNRKYYNN